MVKTGNRRGGKRRKQELGKEKHEIGEEKNKK